MDSKYGIHFETPAFLMQATCELCDEERSDVTHTRGPKSDLCNICVPCFEFTISRIGAASIWYADER